MRILAAAILSSAAVTTLAPAALANSGELYIEVGYVVAESQWGHGTVSGPVRRGPRGWQVRLPGGTWINCVRSCTQTLRQQTVDFWETNTGQPRDGGPGYFHLEFRF